MAAYPVAFANAVLLISGHQQFLIIPSFGQHHQTLALTEKDLEEITKTGTAIPLNVDSTQMEEHQSLGKTEMLGTLSTEHKTHTQDAMHPAAKMSLNPFHAKVQSS